MSDLVVALNCCMARMLPKEAAILSKCPAHCNLLLTSPYVCFSVILYLHLTPPFFSCLPSIVTLVIFRTQLFSHTCSLCYCSSVSAKVSVPYRHAGFTQVIMTLPFSLFEIRGSPSPPQLLSTCSLRPVLFDVPLSPSSSLLTESVSSPPA